MHATALRAALAALALALPSGAQTLVENANQAVPVFEPSGAPQMFQDVGGRLYFRATTQEWGIEPWLTDGTEQGTQLLLDLYPGTGSSDPREMTELSPGVWVFGAVTPGIGFELWRTDMTPEGTQLVADIVPGPETSGLAYLEEHAGEVFFYARNAALARGLWKTDGTPAGTVEVSDFSVGGSPTFTNGTETLLSTSLGLFFTTVSSNEWRLWSTDGTPGGEQLLAEVEGNISDRPQHLIEFNGELYFAAGSDADGIELWASDGTSAGTRQVVELAPGPADTRPVGLTEFGGELFFVSNGLEDRELWKTDGTQAGTVQITSDTIGGVFSIGTDPSDLTPTDSFLLFSGNRSDVGRELFATTGVPGQWFPVADVNPGPTDSDPVGITELNGELVFSALREGSDRELFATDGTPEGTRLVANLWLEGQSFPSEFTALGDELLFRASDGLGTELWATDATPSGTALVRNIDVKPDDAGSFPRVGLPSGSRAVYHLDDAQTGRELWVTTEDGSSASLLLDIDGASTTSVIDNPFRWRGLGFFPAADAATGAELWVTDGTAAGTQLLADLNTGPADAFPRVLGVFGDEVYFAANTDTVTGALYATDGTTAGTRLVADVGATSSNGYRSNWAVLGGRAFFVVFTPGVGSELWSTDGTSAGTQLYIDLWPGSTSGMLNPELVAFDGSLWFTGNAPDEATSFFIADGTAPIPIPFKDFNPDGSDFVGPLYDLGEYLVLPAQNPENSRQLFSIDAATRTVTELTSIPPTSQSSGANGAIHVAGDVLYLVYDEAGVSAQNLLRTDGTLAGTQLIATIDPTGEFDDPFFSQPAFVTTDGKLVFGGNDGTFGQELWVTDGTAVGTQRLTDVDPFGGDAAPDDLMRAGSRLYFAASDGVVGRELHSIPVTATGGWVAEPFGYGCAGATGVPTLGFGGEARIGATFSLELSGAAPLATSFLFLDLSGAPTDLGGGCTVYLPNPSLTATLPTDLNGGLTLPLTIPDLPILAGLNVWSQVLVADSLGALNGTASLSNAFEIVIGG